MHTGLRIRSAGSIGWLEEAAPGGEAAGCGGARAVGYGAAEAGGEVMTTNSSTSSPSLEAAQRTELGRLLLNNLDIARNVDDRQVRWQFRIFQFPSPAPQLGFGVCSRLDDETRAGFGAWLLLRHHERGTHAQDLDALMSVVVLLTPRHDGYRDWDTSMYGITGDHELTDDELRQYRELWNRTPEVGSTDEGALGVGKGLPDGDSRGASDRRVDSDGRAGEGDGQRDTGAETGDPRRERHATEPASGGLDVVADLPGRFGLAGEGGV